MGITKVNKNPGKWAQVCVGVRKVTSGEVTPLKVSARPEVVWVEGTGCAEAGGANSWCVCENDFCRNQGQMSWETVGCGHARKALAYQNENDKLTHTWPLLCARH